MAEQAKITSLDALEHFRSALVQYVTKSRRSLDEVSEEVRRTRMWLEGEQRLHWEGELRRRTKKLEQAQEELYSAQLSSLQRVDVVKKMAVEKWKRAVEEAEGKLRAIKGWHRKFDSDVEPLAKRLEGFRHLLTNEMPKAIAFLNEAQKALHAYAETRFAEGQPNNRPPVESDSPDAGAAPESDSPAGAP